MPTAANLGSSLESPLASRLPRQCEGPRDRPSLLVVPGPYEPTDGDFWIVPPPPAPSSVNATLPARSPEYKVFEGLLGDLDYGAFRIRQRILKVERWWEFLVSATVSPKTPYSKSLTVTIGVTNTITETEGFARTIGVTHGFSFYGLSAQLSREITHTYSREVSVSVSEERSFTDTFHAVSHSATILVAWWQLAERYTLEARYVSGIPGFGPQIEVPVKSAIVSRQQAFRSSQFPPLPEDAEAGTPAWGED